MAIREIFSFSNNISSWSSLPKAADDAKPAPTSTPLNALTDIIA